MNFVALLPPELTEEIFSYLPVRDLIVCGAVCVSWRTAADNFRLWKNHGKNINHWLLPDSKIKRCDVITSNFPDKSRSLKALMPNDNFKPFNPYKVYACQQNFLKYNWTNGIYTDYGLSIEGCVIYRSIEVFYPSKSPHDCLYYPICGKFRDGLYGFFLIRLDSKPSVVKKLFTTDNPDIVERMCVMRDCLVWLSEGNVEYFALNSKPEKTEVLILGNLDFDSIDCSRCLTMDANYIVAVSLSVKVWCKQTLNLKFVHKPQSVGILDCYLYDGSLICAFSPNFISSSIKIYNLTNDASNMLQNEFNFDGFIQKIVCNKFFFIFQYYDAFQFTYHIQVKDKKTFTIKCSHVSQYPITEISNEFIAFNDHDGEKIDLFNFITGESYVLTQFWGYVYSVFDNIAMIRGENSVEVWDWKKRIKLYTLFATDTATPHKILHVSEAWVLTVDRSCNLKIYGFG